MDATAAVIADQLTFACPSCSAPYSWSTASPSAREARFPVSCSQCGIAFSVRNPSQVVVAPAGSEVGQRVAASSADAWAALWKILSDPVAGLAPAYASLGTARAQAAGIALAVFFALASALGVMLGTKHWLGSMLYFGTAADGAGGVVKLVVAFLVVPLVMIGIAYGGRQILRVAPAVAVDVFTCGAAVSPVGVAILVGGLLGNVEIAAVLMFFAVSYLLLILFAGLTKIGGLSEKVAAPIVPLLLLLTGWLSKVISAAMLSGGTP